jgi:hypothetical protein
MAAITRWVEYYVDGEGEAGTGGGTAEGCGTRGYTHATGGSGADSFNIGSGNNQLHVSIDGDSAFITLASGSGQDPRFIARDITEKLHNLGKNNPRYDQAQCLWHNNALRLYSGSLGSSSGAVVVSGTNTAHVELGWGTADEVGGSNNNPGASISGSLNQYNGGVSVSGTYNGFFDETYTIVIANAWTIGTPVKGGTNSYTGTISAGGVFNAPQDITYTLYIDVSNGTTMGAGAGNVPKLSWISTGNVDNSAAAVDLLYPNYYYKVGIYGLMVKFTDAVFNSCQSPNAAWTVACTKPDYTHGTNTQGAAGNAYYVWGSDRGDDAGSSTQIITSETSWTRLGSRGVYIKFTGDNNFLAGDQFKVICTPPQPKSYDITNLNYGNVTVSTEAPVKAVIFEILSGAIEMSTIKFGLQSHGTFEHHDENNSDTYFRFGTLGPGQSAGSGDVDGLEWRTNCVAADISSDTPPSYMYATKANLHVVSDADDSETIGASSFMGMTSDPIFLNIKLGASEVGANSTINYRIFFDYS